MRNGASPSTLSRLEVLVDAAFAFAMTMLVIAVEDVPRSYDELIVALKGVPAFAASFALIMLVWWSHRRWSERYLLHDAPTTVLTLLLIFVVMVFVYPLKIVALAFFYYLSGGWLQSPGLSIELHEMVSLFVIYGSGFAVTAACLGALYARSLKYADVLQLSVEAKRDARAEIAGWAVMGTTAIVSVLWALLLPAEIAVFAGFVYVTLCISMPLCSWYVRR